MKDAKRPGNEIQGEGDYEAARRFNSKQEAFAKSPRGKAMVSKKMTETPKRKQPSK